MKYSIIISALIITVLSFSANAQNSATANSSLSQVLSQYYDLKNALEGSDAATASKKAGELLKTINNLDIKSLSATENKAFTAVQSKLSYDARHISEVQNLDHQREHFASLSLNVYSLAKAAKLSAQPVFELYCPMKKAYWLSNDSAVKNPYYGSQMLTCGKVTETIQ
jgi:hypothetical protein